MKSNRFKNLGVSMLKRPDTMERFLKEPESSTHPEIHSSTFAQSRNSTSTARLHIQIRKDLADKIVCEVFHRKRDSNVSNRHATQRAIIEEALDIFFKEKARRQSI